MNASHTLLRRALLGGSAIGLMMAGSTTGADELSDLKAQLETLKSRVQQIETTDASAPAAPAGASFITMRKGQLTGFDPTKYQANNTRAGDEMPTGSGYTFAITPSADLPAPVMEVTVSGYVKGDVIYDTHNDVGDSFSTGAIAASTAEDDERTTIHARQSRFRIRSRSDTAVGQIRTLIEGDFDVIAGGNQVISNSNPFRLRHAWGEWDMTPSTTLGFGQTWTTFMTLFGPAPTVDFAGPTGYPFIRQGQLRLTHKNGPTTFRIAVENPETDIRTSTGAGLFESLGGGGVTDEAPDIVASATYAAPGGSMFRVAGVVRFLGLDTANGATGDDHETGWGIHAAAKVNLTPMITLYGLATIGDGIGRYIIDGGGNAGTTNAATAAGSTNFGLTSIYGFVAGATLKVSPVSSFNANFGYTDHVDNIPAGGVSSQATIHVNYLWQPVSKLRFGVEGIYAENNVAGPGNGDNLRLQFGAWFFF